jgi:rare lipoprotein A (peptidoglycan hydrolase)
MERTFLARMSWLICGALSLGGCSAYSAANTPVRPAPLQSAVQAAPASSHVTLASWYGPGFVGQHTASGEVYHRDDLTAASRNLPLGTRVQVTNLNTGRAVVVRINDRGPYVHGRGIDLSQRAAERIGLNHSGVARVSVTRIDTTASASPMLSAPHEWSGKARMSPYAPHHYRSTRRYTHHYRYVSMSPYRSSHRMVANPIGHWLLQMVH